MDRRGFRYATAEQRKAVDAMETDMLEKHQGQRVIVSENPDIASFQEATADLYLKPEVTALVDPSLVRACAPPLQVNSK